METELKWVEKSYRYPLGETGDYDTTYWLERGKERIELTEAIAEREDLVAAMLAILNTPT